MDKKNFIIIGIAVLIAIVIALIGIYRYNSSTGSISNLAKINQQNPVVIFNNQFIMYAGKTKGYNIPALINTIISSNSSYSEGKLEYGKLVALKYDGLGGEVEDVYIVPNMNDIKKDEMLEFAETIDKEHYYYVDVTIGERGISDKVNISYLID